MRLFLSLIFVSFCFVLVGCGPSGPATNKVKGKISLNGEAVKEGLIYFDNTDKTLPSANAPIKDGDYSATLVKGKYMVRINGTKLAPYPPGKVGASGEKEGPQQYLPAKFNEKTELTAEVAGTRDDLDFILKSK